MISFRGIDRSFGTNQAITYSFTNAPYCWSCDILLDQLATSDNKSHATSHICEKSFNIENTIEFEDEVYKINPHAAWLVNR